MRILFTAHSGPSHLRVLVPLVRLARQRGHEVHVASAPATSGATGGVALPPGAVHPVGHDWSGYRDAADAVGAHLVFGANDTAVELMLEHFHFGTPALDAARDLLPLVARLRPDVVVREAEDVAGYLAAEAAGVPHVAVASGNTHDLDRAASVPRLDGMRAALGMAPEPAGGGLYRHLLASLLPVGYHGDGLGGTVPRCYRENDHDPDTALPGWIAALDPAKPLVFASLGTVVMNLANMADGALADIVTALGQVDCEAVVTVGAGRALLPGTTPAPHVHVVAERLPQTRLLEVADLFVTHAGFSSVRETAHAGVPVVSIPFWDDQPYHASRLAALGMGVTVARRRPRPGRPRPIAEAVRQVLDDPSYRVSARAFRRDVLALPPLSALLDDVETIAAGGVPDVTDVADDLAVPDDPSVPTDPSGPVGLHRSAQVG